MKLPAGSWLIKTLAAFCSLAVVLLIFTGYAYLRGQHARQVGDGQNALTSTPAPSPLPAQVTIYENEPTLKGSIAILSGTILNKSTQGITNLSVELELIPRQGETPSTRLVSVKPKVLPPDITGNYRLEVSSRTYSGARVRGLIATTTAAADAAAADGQQQTVAVGFNIEVGTRRRKEPPPGVSSPDAAAAAAAAAARKRSTNRDGFLNSPENPVGLN